MSDSSFASQLMRYNQQKRQQGQQPQQQFFLASEQSQDERRARINLEPTADEQGLFYKGTVQSIQRQKKRLNQQLSQQTGARQRIAKQLSQQKIKNEAVQQEYINRIDNLTLTQNELKAANEELITSMKSATGMTDQAYQKMEQLRQFQVGIQMMNEKIILQYTLQAEQQATQITNLYNTIEDMKDNENVLKLAYGKNLNRLNHTLEQSTKKIKANAQQVHQNQVKELFLTIKRLQDKHAACGNKLAESHAQLDLALEEIKTLTASCRRQKEGKHKARAAMEQQRVQNQAQLAKVKQILQRQRAEQRGEFQRSIAERDGNIAELSNAIEKLKCSDVNLIKIKGLTDTLKQTNAEHDVLIKEMMDGTRIIFDGLQRELQQARGLNKAGAPGPSGSTGTSGPSPSFMKNLRQSDRIFNKLHQMAMNPVGPVGPVGPLEN